MRGYGESDKPSGVDNYVIDKLDNDLKVNTKAYHQERLIVTDFQCQSIMRIVIKGSHKGLVAPSPPAEFLSFSYSFQENLIK